MQRLEVSSAVRPLYGSLGVKGLKSKTTFVVKYNLLEPQEIIFWTQNQSRKRLYQKLGHIRGKTKIFTAYSTTEPHLITQAGLNDLFRDLVLLKTKAQLFGRRLQ